MPKLAIYVPKKEMRQIERWRKRINFSQIFMKALREEIRDRSRDSDVPDRKLAAAARHYRGQLEAGSGLFEDFGFQLGQQHVLECHLEPETIRRFNDWEPVGSLTADQTAEIEHAIGSDISKARSFAKKQIKKEQSHPLWQEAVYRGYLKGVAAAWQQVCQEMKNLKAK